MSAATYSEKLRDPRWQRKRLEILNRDEFTCQLCGDTETELHIHHKKYNGDPWGSDNVDLTTLCKYCHYLLEDAAKYNLEITKVYYFSPSIKIATSVKGVHLLKMEQDGSVDIKATFDFNDELLVRLCEISGKPKKKTLK